MTRLNGALGEKQPYRLRLQPLEHQRFDALGGEGSDVCVAGRHDDGDPVGLEPSSSEQQGIRRSRVEPVRVIDDAQDRPGLRRLCEERQ